MVQVIILCKKYLKNFMVSRYKATKCAPTHMLWPPLQRNHTVMPYRLATVQAPLNLKWLSPEEDLGPALWKLLRESAPSLASVPAAAVGDCDHYSAIFQRPYLRGTTESEHIDVNVIRDMHGMRENSFVDKGVGGSPIHDRWICVVHQWIA